MSDAKTEQQQAEEALKSAFNLYTYIKTHWASISLVLLLCGATTYFNKKSSVPLEKMDASLTNQVKGFDKQDSIFHMLQGFFIQNIAQQTALSNLNSKVDNMAADLVQLPAINRIEKRRQDSISRAYPYHPFTSNP